jgi:hypothetical protein
VKALYGPWHSWNGVVQLNKCGNLYFGLGNHGKSAQYSKAPKVVIK